ncbi:uncharacterized protein LOC130297699 [Hyla sarda]|uniref:uncharacterized protein LOC130297699 n=1 Tax=Hyla sarda TaxID=327740 RepID=UPI0024C2E1B9|nr:uncharacterized protein LOC130297699 [Hyla sarda]XP_056406438.1 uncharacterized protein LOC130297699 [Hyla sarda]XP_056406439.1 uncharacterized protein LOC130297699 [Hyla sarda]
MMFLWAFVLLAVATSSVNSQCSCPCSNNNVVKKTFTEHSTKITTYKPDSLQKLDLSSILNLLTTISNLAFLDVKIDTAEVRNTTNGFQIGAELTVMASCLELQKFTVKLSIWCNLNLNVMNGHSNWELLEDTLSITASVNGDKIVSLSTSVIKSIVDLIVKLLRSILKFILQLCVERLNYVNSQATKAYQIGTTECRNQFTAVKQQGGNAVGEIITEIGNQQVAWGEIGKYELTKTESQSWNIGSNVILALAKQVVTQISSKIKFFQGSWSAESWGAKYEALNVVITVKAVKSCTFTDNGANLDIQLTFSLYDGSSLVATLEANAILPAQPKFENGYFSLIFTSNLKIDLAFTVISVDSNCGCNDKIASWLKANINLNFHTALDGFNCHFKKLLPLPPVIGEVGLKGECVSKSEYCRCASLK